jgi:hypothetical protein
MTEHLMWGVLIRRKVISVSVKPFAANFAALYAACGTCGPIDAQKPVTLLVWQTCVFE